MAQEDQGDPDTQIQTLILILALPSLLCIRSRRDDPVAQAFQSLPLYPEDRKDQEVQRVPQILCRPSAP